MTMLFFLIFLTWVASELIRPRPPPPPPLFRRRSPKKESDLDDQNPYKLS